MDKQQILERQHELQTQFDTLKAAIAQKQQEITESETELNRLQGRYAELDELLKRLDEPVIPEDTPASNVLHPEPAEGEIVPAGEPSEETDGERRKG